MKEILANEASIAYCGLFCGACRRFLNGGCLGCQQNAKASWCKVRSCCMEHKYKSCADCADFKEIMDCPKYNNIMAKLFGLIFRSNRSACIALIKEVGYEGYAKEMAAHKAQSIRRGKTRPG